MDQNGMNGLLGMMPAQMQQQVPKPPPPPSPPQPPAIPPSFGAGLPEALGGMPQPKPGLSGPGGSMPLGTTMPPGTVPGQPPQPGLSGPGGSMPLGTTMPPGTVPGQALGQPLGGQPQGASAPPMQSLAPMPMPPQENPQGQDAAMAEASKQIANVGAQQTLLPQDQMAMLQKMMPMFGYPSGGQRPQPKPNPFAGSPQGMGGQQQMSDFTGF